jgi:hypothetical protein
MSSSPGIELLCPGSSSSPVQTPRSTCFVLRTNAEGGASCVCRWHSLRSDWAGCSSGGQSLRRLSCSSRAESRPGDRAFKVAVLRDQGFQPMALIPRSRQATTSMSHARRSTTHRSAGRVLAWVTTAAQWPSDAAAVASERHAYVDDSAHPSGRHAELSDLRSCPSERNVKAKLRLRHHTRRGGGGSSLVP